MDRCSNSGRKSQKRESKKKEDQNARKGRKVAKHCVLPMFCGAGGWKVRLPKAAGIWPDERSTLRRAVVRSTFRSQNVKNTSFSEDFQPPVDPSAACSAAPVKQPNTSYRCPIFETSAPALRGTTGTAIIVS